MSFMHNDAVGREERLSRVPENSPSQHCTVPGGNNLINHAHTGKNLIVTQSAKL